MAFKMTSKDPIELKDHVRACVITLRDGAALDALYMLGFLILFALGKQDFSQVLPGMGVMYLLLLPGCEIWAKVLKRGIHLPSFSFWGRVEFVLAGYMIQFAIKFFLYVGMPFLIVAAVFSLLELVHPYAAVVGIMILAAWPILNIGYIMYQRRRLNLIINCSCSQSGGKLALRGIFR